jgi:hypothetical protein
MKQFRTWIQRLSAYSVTTRYVFCTAIVGIVTVVQLIANLLPAGSYSGIWVTRCSGGAV